MSIPLMQHVGDESTADARYLVISADTHAVARKEAFRPFVDARYREAFDSEVDREDFERASVREWSQRYYATEQGASDDEKYLHWNRAAEDAEAAETWEPARWLTVLEGDGIVASVIYPGGSLSRPPFEGTWNRTPPELQAAGRRIYNRWLAAFCSEAPTRLAGVCQLPAFDDIGSVVEEIDWAAHAGLRGGVLVPPLSEDRPGYHDPVYDPMWAACQDHDLVVNFHGGGGGSVASNPRLYGTGPVAEAIAFHDARPAFRPLWFLILGGVLERFPGLKVCFTEQLANWVPHELKRLDDVFHDTSFSALLRLLPARQTLSLTPTEYWRRNCCVGATFMSRPEAQARYEIGIDNIMWGSDFPHPEGTYPVTRESLRHSFAAIPQEELRPMLGLNAARVYNFDLVELGRLAATVGPPVAALREVLEHPPLAYRTKHAFRPN